MSRPPRSRLASSLGLSLLLAWLVLPGIGRADDDDDDKKKNNNETQQTTSKNKRNTSNRPDAPDLEVTGLSLQANALGQVSDREVMFRVGNIGSEDAPASTARVEITGPVVNVTGSGSPVVRTVAVPALKAGGNPFYATAELPGVCDGHIVKVSVDLKGDAAAGNNSAGPTKVCPELPPPSAGGPAGTLDQARRQGTGLSLPNPGAQNTVDYGDAAIIPEHMRVGTHTMTLTPNHFDMAERNNNSTAGAYYHGLILAGWEQEESSDLFGIVEYNRWTVTQTGVNFDLGQLDEVPRKVIQKALLTFDESPFHWMDADGNSRTVAGCVAVLGIATADLSQTGLRELYPNDYYADVIPSASREWDVTGHVRDQVRFPQDASLRHGYVLRGALEELEGEDDTSCLSSIQNPRLHITYVVPAN